MTSESLEERLFFRRIAEGEGVCELTRSARS